MAKSRRRNYCRLEICCFNVESALIAIEAGADRIEFCGGGPHDGGLTPWKEDLKRLKEASDGTRIHVMIRVRGGDFVYTKQEIDFMIYTMKELEPWADGFVFGVLTESKKINIHDCTLLRNAAADKPCFFHKAIDHVEEGDFLDALKLVWALGFKGVLTSGTKPNAQEGAELLYAATAEARINFDIMVGGGVRSSNLSSLMETTKAKWYHSSALVDGSMKADAEEIRRMVDIALGGSGK